MSKLLVVTGGVTDGYTIDDAVTHSLSCNHCGAKHPVSIECNPEKKASWQAHWKRIADRFAKEFGWIPYW